MIRPTGGRRRAAPGRRLALRAARTALLTVTGTGLALGAITAPAQAATTDLILLPFGGTPGSTPSLTNSGSLGALVTGRVVTSGGGALTTVAAVPGQGTAARFPAFAASSSGPRAIVSLKSSDGVERLSPGTAWFEVGVDVALDSVSEAAGSSDDGNNAIQRGLYNDPSQFKVQVDARRPSCRVKGASGAVQVTSSVTLTPGAWYRLRCTRTPGNRSDTVTIKVTPLRADGSLGTATSTSRSGAVGRLSYPVSVPMSVGGKLGGNGSIYLSASDQFNGAVDNAVLRLG